MARFRCTACGRNGECDCTSYRHKCPHRWSASVVFALAIDEVPEERVATLLRAEPLDDDNNHGD